MRSKRERTRPSAPTTVCVVHHPRGRWEVMPLGSRGKIACESLDEARHIAYLAVAHADDCELVVRDAYNRVLEHELIDGHRGPQRGLTQSTNG